MIFGKRKHPTDFQKFLLIHFDCIGNVKILFNYFWMVIVMSKINIKYPKATRRGSPKILKIAFFELGYL